MPTKTEIKQQEYIEQLEDTLKVFRKIVVVNRKQYVPGYPLCQGCDELALARGWECWYKPTTTDCKYPEDFLKATKETRNANREEEETTT